MKKQLRDMRTSFLLSACLLMAIYAGRSLQASNDDEAKPVITVTPEPQHYFTEAIAGGKSKIASVVPKGSSPETYGPVLQQLASLGDSKACFHTGYIGFGQTRMDRLMDNTPHIQVFDISKGIDFTLNSDDHSHAHGYNSNDGYIHIVEPHIWNSIGNALIIAGNTYKALSQLDKVSEICYRNRCDSLCQCIQRADSLIRRRLSVPEAAKAFMICHPVLSYFARDYGLHQISTGEEGKEPPPARPKALVDLCQAEDVRVVFVQPEFDKCNTETVAQQTGTKMIPTNPLSYDWEEEMLSVTKTLALQVATR